MFYYMAIKVCNGKLLTESYETRKNIVSYKVQNIFINASCLKIVMLFDRSKVNHPKRLQPASNQINILFTSFVTIISVVRTDGKNPVANTHIKL